MYIPKESFDSKVLRWSGLAMLSFITTVFAVGLATRAPTTWSSEPAQPSTISVSVAADVSEVQSGG